jgi:histidine triad (HIT) family protein
MTTGCVFCEIAAGRVPAQIVAESPGVLAFRDINPAAPTHVLLIPREHIADSAADLGPKHQAVLGELFELAARVARMEEIDEGWRLVSNVGPAAGQTVHHVHFHLLGGWGRSGARRLADESGG